MFWMRKLVILVSNCKEINDIESFSVSFFIPYNYNY